jgi:glycosyltransferase involved in cell wall biosynthesis
MILTKFQREQTLLKKVLLINWDCYPNITTGGIYTWTKSLIDALSDYEFVVLNEISNPNANAEYTIPKNVTKVMEVPIFGSIRYEEFCKRDNLLLARILRTTQHIIKEKFIPLYKEFLNSVLSDRCNPRVLTDIVIKLHDLLTVYDAKKCLEHPETWDIFVEKLNKEPLYNNMKLNEVLVAYQLIQRNIQLLSIKVPKVDLIHCSLAWLPSLVAIYAKKESNCPVLVTEHGVAFRELVLFWNGYLYDEPSKIFWKVFSHNIVRTIYFIADSFTPVCNANKIWEESLGVDTSKVKVIYNGVNTSKFRPIEGKREDKRPTVVSVARIDAFKDIVCLIQAIKYAKEQISDIQCLIYGTSVNLDYSFRCLRTVKELHLEDTVRFMGGTKEPEIAYNAADVIAVSSITEGFPFSIIEAMACGKAVVASDVGGVGEALKDCGLLVRSRRPRELGEAIVRLIKDENLRHKFEMDALKKVHDEFTLEKCVEGFKKEYEKLTSLYKSEKEKQKLKEMILQ